MKGAWFVLTNLREAFRDRAMLRRIVHLAWPTVMEEMLYAMVGYADTAQVGALGARASAAVGLTSTTVWLLRAPAFAASMGVLSCISISLGAKNRERARTAAMQAVILTLAIGLLLTALTLSISGALPRWLGGDPEIRHDASVYFAITCIPFLFRTATTVFGSVLRATGNTKTPMQITALMNVSNILLNFLFIFPARQVTLAGLSFRMWGFGWGVMGAAVATAISFTLGGVLMTLAVWQEPILALKGQPIRYDGEVMAQCIRVGAPLCGQHLISGFGHVVFTSLIARLGTVPMAAHTIAMNAEEAFYIPGYGMQAAAATLAGFSAGEKNEKKLRQYTAAIMAIAACVMTVLGSLLFFFPHVLMGLFTRDPEVIRMGAGALRVVAVSEPFFAILIILDGVFNGIGDTKMPFVFSAITMWGVRILGTFICVNVFHLGLSAVWMCMVGDNVSRCGLMLSRYLSGRWKKQLHFDAPENG